MNFYENLENLLKKKNITIYKLCKDIQVNTSTLGNYKNGTIPKIDIIEKIALYLGVTTDELIFGNTENRNIFDNKLLTAYHSANIVKQECVCDILKIDRQIENIEVH